ncbi:MAG: hypothetical protein OEZ51_13015 [Nitrospinota bacterium]|nr:hypothetical protein [Nitrospinota bacterium]
MNELSEPTNLLKTFKHVLTSGPPEDTYKVYRELYQLGDAVIPALEEKLLAYQWENIKYGMEMTILSGFLSLANDINEERAREVGEKIREKGCNEIVEVRIKSILDFSLDDFEVYSANGVDIYQSKNLKHETRIKPALTRWLSFVPEEDIKKIARLYLIPKDESYAGTYMPILCNIMVVWDMFLSYYNPLSYFLLLRIESTLYHEIGHHAHRHTFGQDPEQEKEADRYAAEMLKKTHPILNIVVKTLKFAFGKRKAGKKIK